MPDITMCVNNECPLRKYCYRYLAVPDQWQSYSFFIPKEILHFSGKTTKCDYFWDTTKELRKIQRVEDVDKQLEHQSSFVKKLKGE